MQVLGIIKVAILATDIACGLVHTKTLREITDSGTFSWKNHQHRYLDVLLLTTVYISEHLPCRELVYSVLMTACDLCATCKPWEVNRRVVDDLFMEFHQQV